MSSHYDIIMPRVPIDLYWEVDAARPRGLLPVGLRSPLAARKAVERIASYFRRECAFDFLQYSAKGDDASAFLWVGSRYIGETNVAHGAACFRRLVDGWMLSWVWLHPYMRDQGLLTKAWSYFEAKFGEFFVDPPLSPAMKSFLIKRNALSHAPYLKPPQLAVLP